MAARVEDFDRIKGSGRVWESVCPAFVGCPRWICKVTGPSGQPKVLRPSVELGCKKEGWLRVGDVDAVVVGVKLSQNVVEVVKVGDTGCG